MQIGRLRLEHIDNALGYKALNKIFVGKSADFARITEGLAFNRGNFGRNEQQSSEK